MSTKSLRLNGKKVTVSVADGSQQLLYLLREQLAQRGPKFGCGVSQCGACTVLVDGKIVRSCVTAISTVADGADVTTLDGLSNNNPHPMQTAFVDLQAGQCAFCMNGMIMGAVGWIEGRIAAGNTAVPTEQEVADHLSGASADSTLNYICRCGSHPRIVAAIVAAAQEMV